MISVAKKPLHVFPPENDRDYSAEPSRKPDTSPPATPVLRTFGGPSPSTSNSDSTPLSFSLAQARLEANEPIVQPEGNLALTYRFAKRSLDVIGSAALIVMLSPILLTVFVILSITTKGRPIIRQQRVGHLGRRFPMFKFRSLRLDAEKLQHLVRNEKDGPIFKNRNDPRITRIGRILRRTSIDEMPQLFNVLVGHMSLVGPRPPLAKEVAQYKPWQRRRRPWDGHDEIRWSG